MYQLIQVYNVQPHFYNFALPIQQNKEINNNIQAMDLKKYYSHTPRGRYVVHFENNTAMSPFEINNIFKQFGAIDSCSQTGGKRGLCFVNYRTEEGVRKCITMMQNHPVIKLRLIEHYTNYKYSTNSLNKNNNSTQQSRSSTGGSEKSFGASSAKDSEAMAVNSPREVEKTLDELEKMPSNRAINSFIADADSDTEDLPKLVSALKTTSLKSEIQDSTQMGMCIPKKRQEIIEAQEIIVANINENYGVPSILHLLERYNPICISPIKTCKSYPIRYCHVYFSEISKAQAAERDFDEYEWLENKLMVLQADTLASLATATINQE